MLSEAVFFSPSRIGSFEINEKRSRFLGSAIPITSEPEAKERIAEIEAKHHGARHNAWAYVLIDGSERYSDDGEPQGTAGAPIIELMRHGNMRAVLTVVTRYFGGVLLGPGGLARAYTAAAKGAIEDSCLKRCVVRRRLLITADYALTQRIKHEIGSSGGIIESSDYGASVKMAAVVKPEMVESLRRRIKDLSSGRDLCEDIGTAVITE